MQVFGTDFRIGSTRLHTSAGAGQDEDRSNEATSFHPTSEERNPAMIARRTILAWMLPLLLPALLLTSCGAKDPVSPQQQAPHEQGLEPAVANGIAAQAAGTVMSGGPIASAKSLLSMFGASPVARGRMTRPARVGSVKSDSTEFTYEIRAYDAAGNEVQWAWVASDSIARVTMSWHYFADISDTSGAYLSRYDGNYEFTGLQSTEPRIVMSGVEQFGGRYQGHSGNMAWLYVYSSDDAIDHVAWEKSGTPAYLVAGALAMNFKGNWDSTYEGQRSTGSFDVRVRLTLNGTQFADLLVDDRYHYKLDLVTGAVQAVSPQTI